MTNRIIEVFRTNVFSETIAENIIYEIKTICPNIEVNFDLDDCDHILRVVATNYFEITKASSFLVQAGYICEVLPD